MKLQATQKAALVLVGSLMATLPFQNCGKSVQFSSFSSESGKPTILSTNVGDPLGSTTPISLPPDSDNDDSNPGNTPPGSNTDPDTPPGSNIGDNTNDPIPTVPDQTPDDPSDPDASDNVCSASVIEHHHDNEGHQCNQNHHANQNNGHRQSLASAATCTPADGDVDFDEDGKFLGSECSSGANEQLVDVSALSSAQDVVLKNFSGHNVKVEEARQFSITDFSGGNVFVKAALDVVQLTRFSGHNVRIRADVMRDINPGENVPPLSLQKLRLSAREMGAINQVSGRHLCASARKFGDISNLSLGNVSKIVGRADAGAKAPIGRISYLSTGTYVLSRVKGSTISHFSGTRLIIRDSEFDEISDVSGKLVLINSKVNRLKNVSGRLVIKKSQVSNLEEITGETQYH
jgi:hypothetical protein